MANPADSARKTSGGVAVGVRSVIALGHGRIVIARIGTRCGAACVARVPVALRERGNGHSEAQKRTQRDHGCLLFHVISPALIGERCICRCHPTLRNACSALLPFTHFCANPCDLRLILFRPTDHAFHARHHLKSHGNIDRIDTACGLGLGKMPHAAMWPYRVSRLDIPLSAAQDRRWSVFLHARARRLRQRSVGPLR